MNTTQKITAGIAAAMAGTGAAMGVTGQAMSPPYEGINLPDTEIVRHIDAEPNMNKYDFDASHPVITYAPAESENTNDSLGKKLSQAGEELGNIGWAMSDAYEAAEKVQSYTEAEAIANDSQLGAQGDPPQDANKGISQYWQRSAERENADESGPNKGIEAYHDGGGMEMGGGGDGGQSM